MAYEKKDTGYLVVISVLVLGLLYLAFGNKGTSVAGRTADEPYNDGDIKCELTGANGRTITITGSGPEFERMCRQQNYPLNLYGYQWYPLYYYTWYRPWGWRRWPSGGHGSGTGGGTGGGGGTGTGAGTGTPGTGTP